ncbi:MAG: S-layer homology domain-containing protein, partial [Butyricicoccus sp.]
NFTNCADALNQMGLFSGTDKGYELDREPTRAEAAVMLVRLLGGEKEATAKNYTTPFTDVPSWAAPYVGWLYENGLTAGATETTFGTTGKCTAQMYSTFLLRSLGYQDTGASPDFQYANAIQFAEEKGVADYANCDTDNFLRDNVVAMSYTALATQPKDGQHATLLDQLTASGAVDSTKSASAKTTFAAYNEYAALSEKMQNVTDMAMTMKADVDVKMNNTALMTMNMNMDIKAKMDLNKLDNSKLAMTGKTTMKIDPSLVESGESTTQTMDMAAYYTAGNYYVKSGDEKIKMAMSFDDMMSGMNLDMMKGEPLCMFKSIAKNSDGSFSISYAPEFMNSMISDILSQTGMASGEATKLNKVDFTVTPKNGTIGSMKADMDMSTTVEGQTVQMTMAMDYTITATGSSVTVTLPSDLNTYKAQ